jgi:CRISPR-associated endoribonuclease Cas6
VNFYEIKIDVILKNKIHFQKAPQAISKLIATHLINCGYDKHNENIIKNYVFSNLGKADKNGFFEGEKSFYFRTFDEDIAKKIIKITKFNDDKIFNIKKTNLKIVKRKPIKKIYTLNPVFVTVDGKKGKFWTFKHDLNFFLTALNNNLLKKYNLITSKNLLPHHSFIQQLQFKNSSPFSYYFKNKRFLGYKLEIIPYEDETSQILSFIALGSGLGEKNSTVGGGFCKAIFE